MSRTAIVIGFAIAGASLAAAPAAAFWPRSQWLACSEAPTAAEYRRWRCWELDIYDGAITPGYGAGADRPLTRPGPRGSIRRGGAVSRLG